MRTPLSRVMVTVILLTLGAWGWLIVTHEKPFNPYSPWETSSQTVEAKMAGVTFHVPGNYLVGFLEKSKVKPDELRDGFAIHALMPDFEPFSLEKKHEFGKSGQASRVVDVSLRRACSIDNTARRPGAPPCTLEIVEGALLSAYSYPRIPDDQLGDFVPAQIDGMAFDGVLTSIVERQKGRFEAEIYTTFDDAGHRILLICDLSGVVPNPQCRMWFPWQEKFVIYTWFARSMKNDWPQIRSKIIAFFRSIEIAEIQKQ